MNARQMIAKLTAEETTAKAPDKRRVIREERTRLTTSVRQGDADSIAHHMSEAERVLADWAGIR